MHIGVLTSGGDAPGMNAAIRAIVLAAHHYHFKVTGFFHGFNGLLNNESVPLNDHDVRHLIGQGGTLLKSARCQPFTTEDGGRQSAATLSAMGIDTLLVIGGDGSFQGCIHLARFWPGQILGIPGTIDNDIDGTDLSIGYATAIDTAVEAIDKIRDTADAFERIFLVEVMGRHSSYIALNAGMASGAEQILTFENTKDPQQAFADILAHIDSSRRLRGKASYIIVIAEHVWKEGSHTLAKALSQAIGTDCRLCILGYIQRGGRPVTQDRLLATKLGIAAVECAMSGQHLQMVGETRGQINLTPLEQTNNHKKQVDPLLQRAQQDVFDLVANSNNTDTS